MVTKRSVALLALLLGVAGVAICPIQAAEPDSNAAARQYLAAAALQNREQFDLAATAWSQFVKQFPGDPRSTPARHYLGVCQLKAKLYAQAAETFAGLLSASPKLPPESFKVEAEGGQKTTDLLEPTYLYLGVTRFRQADAAAAADKPRLYAEANEALAALSRKYPTGKYAAQAVFYQGEIAYSGGDKRQAATWYKQVVEKFPNDPLVPNALYAWGVAAEEAGFAAAAEGVYARFLTSYPRDPLVGEVGMRQAEMALAQKKYEAAEAGFAAAAALPDFSLADHALMRQAASLQEHGKYAEAAAIYSSLEQRFPKSKYRNSALLSAGKCFYLAGQTEPARAALDNAQKLDGDFGREAVHWLARMELKQKNPQQALRLIDERLAAKPTGAMAEQLELDRAEALLDLQGQKPAALAALVKLADQAKDAEIAPRAAYMAALVALELSNYSQAHDRAAAFVKKYPNHDLLASAMYVDAESELLASHPTEARRKYRELLEKYPQRPESDTWRVRQALAMLLDHKLSDVGDSLEPLFRSGAGGNREMLAEAWFLRGMAESEAKRYDAAAKSLAASLEASPKWRQADEALLALAAAQQQLGKSSDAQSSLDRLLKDFPTSRLRDRAQFFAAEYAATSGNDQAAIDGFARILDGDPKSPLRSQALYGEACAQLRLGKHAEAAQMVDRFLKDYPKHELVPEAQYVRGLARHALGQFAPAADDLSAFATARPKALENAEARYFLALCQIATKQTDKAISTLKNLLDDYPKYALADEAQYELAAALESQGKSDDAASRFEKLAKDYPKSGRTAEARYQIGEIRYRQQRYGAASEAYYAAMNEAGKSELGEAAAYKLGFAYYRDKRYDSARQTFAYQRGTFPKGPMAAEAQFMEAECQFKLNKYSEALALYDKLPELKRGDFKILALLHAGQSAGQLGKWQDAVDRLQLAAKVDAKSPHVPEILYEQAWSLQNLGKLDDAIGVYEEVTRQTNGDLAARSRFMVGEVEFQKKRHEEALRNFFEVAYGYQSPQWQAAAQYEAGRCFEVLGKQDQARKSYQEIVDEFPKSEHADLARKRLAALGS